jgi:hypothetical protein
MDKSSVSDVTFSDKALAWLTVWDETRLRRVMFTVLGVMSGLLVALFTAIVACSVFFYLFPNNVYLDMADTEQAIELMKTVPANDFIVELLAWALAVGLGAYAAERIAKRGGYPAWLTGALFFAFPYPATRPFEGSGVLATFLAIPHPLWVVLISVPLIGLAAYGAGYAAVQVNAGRLQRSQNRTRTRKARPVRATAPAASPAESEISDDMISMDGSSRTDD